MASVTDKLNFKFYLLSIHLNINTHFWLVLAYWTSSSKMMLEEGLRVSLEKMEHLMAKVKMMNLQKGHEKVVKELRTILIEGSCTDSKQRKHFKQGRAINTIKCCWESQVMFTFGYLRIKKCRNLQQHAKYLTRNKFFIVPSGNTSKENTL